MMSFKLDARMRHSDFSDREQPFRPPIFSGFLPKPAENNHRIMPFLTFEPVT